MSDYDCGAGQTCTAGTDCVPCKSCPECDVCCGFCTGGTEPSTCVTSGCSGEICAAEPMASPCIYKPEYACYKLTKCGPFGDGGGCAWASNSEFDECMKNGGAL
jgi:eight-cysteine-cluster-containing protein